MRFVPRSVRWRLTLWSTTVLIVLLAVFAAAAFAMTRAILFDRIRNQIRDDLDRIETAAREDLDELDEFQEHGVVQFFAVTIDGKPAPISDGWNRSIPKSLDDFAHAEAEDAIIESRTGERFRVGGRRFRIGDHDVFALVAADEEPILHALRTFALILIGLLPIATALALGGGYWLAGRLLDPVRVLAESAERITSERLSERLPVPDPSDEFGRLATTFNATLARLQDSFDRMRRFTSDASHELRTPLTAMKSVGEVALRDASDSARCRDAIGSMLEEVDRLTTLVDRLLILTRADAGVYKARFERLDLATLARDVTDWMRPAAEERGITLEIEATSPQTIEADSPTLRQAIMNLIDNALRHGDAAGLVVVRTGHDSAGRPWLEVSDSGPGIALEHHQRIFDRFYRVDPGRSTGDASIGRGCGLGLAIAKWAVELHGGVIGLDSAPGRGSVFQIVFPSRSAPATAL